MFAAGLEDGGGVVLAAYRVAGDLAVDPRPEPEYAAILEEPSLLTLGVCYERRGRFPGSVYQPALRRVESLLANELPRALPVASDQK